MSSTESESLDTSEAEKRAEELNRFAEFNEITEAEEISELISFVVEYEGSEFDLAADALDKIGTNYPSMFEQSVVEFRELIESNDPDEVYIGVRSIAQLAGRHPTKVKPVIDDVKSHLNSDNPRIRAAAIAACAELLEEYPVQMKDIEAEIKAALSHPSEKVRSAAVLAIGRGATIDQVFDDDCIAQLLPRLQDENHSIREKCYWAFINIAIESPEAIPDPDRVIECLDDVSHDDLGLKEGTIEQAKTNLS